ncbi:hypothetical protein [Nostoc sp.]|uniref:hypothetical protein n=1 Tax=Nostoc sp. TaxID=1180 RepID=UPI002FF8DC2B
METLTSEEYNNRFREHLEKTDKELSKSNGFDYAVKSKDKFSTGLFYYVELRPGLWLNIIDEYFERDLSNWNHHIGQPCPLTSQGKRI